MRTSKRSLRGYHSVFPYSIL